MVANMAIPAKQPQHPPVRGGAPDHHRYAWLFQTDRVCKAADRGHGVISSPDDSSKSWETRAFAEDASSLAAGIWPPRSYSCSFCHREFRSAQALGGHMNVHRRDRARMRHSNSPPPAPFCATSHNISLQPPTVMHTSQQGYSSTMGDLHPSTRPEFYPNETLLKPNVALPAAFSFRPECHAPSFAVEYPSDMAAPFPLRLHLLASEAASSLMLPQEESSDQLSLLSASPLDSRNGCLSSIGMGINEGNPIDMSSWSTVPSSSSTSSSSVVLNCAVTSSSVTAATPRRRARHDVPPIQLDKESPRKKSHLTNNSDNQFYEDVGLEICSKDDGKMHTQAVKQTLDRLDIHADDNTRMQQHAWVEAVDLELRLGPSPPP